MNIQPVEYQLTELPVDHPEMGLFSITVRWRGKNGWEVTRNFSDFIMNREGQWVTYPPITEWTESWMASHFWPSLSEALNAARAALPKIHWQGRKASDLLVAHRG